MGRNDLTPIRNAITERNKDMGRTFLLLKVLRNPRLFVFTASFLSSFTNNSMTNPEIRTGKVIMSKVDLHPTARRSAAPTMGAIVDPTIGKDKFNPKTLPRHEL
jgi:hypothetical protein